MPRADDTLKGASMEHSQTHWEIKAIQARLRQFNAELAVSRRKVHWAVEEAQTIQELLQEQRDRVYCLRAAAWPRASSAA